MLKPAAFALLAPPSPEQRALTRLIVAHCAGRPKRIRRFRGDLRALASPPFPPNVIPLRRSGALADRMSEARQAADWLDWLDRTEPVLVLMSKR